MGGGQKAVATLSLASETQNFQEEAVQLVSDVSGDLDKCNKRLGENWPMLTTLVAGQSGDAKLSQVSNPQCSQEEASVVSGCWTEW